MTLAPGESAEFALDLNELFEPEVVEAIRRGERKLEIKPRGDTPRSNGRAFRSMAVLLDGRHIAPCQISWEEHT